MKGLRSLLRVNICFILLYSLGINSAVAQCSEFSVSEYEKMVDLPFSDLKIFVSKKGYTAYETVFL